DPLDLLVDRRAGVGVDDEVGVQRLLVRVRHPGEVGDLARERTLVQALDVALDEAVEGGADVDLDETPDAGVDLVAHLAAGRDRGDEDDNAIARQELGDEADAPDVGVTVFLAESEPLAEVLADDVAVEDLDGQAAGLELGGERGRDRRLARSAE